MIIKNKKTHEELDLSYPEFRKKFAAERCKRRARLIEIDPRYCDVIIWRWQKETGKTAKLVKNYAEVNDGE